MPADQSCYNEDHGRVQVEPSARTVPSGLRVTVWAAGHRLPFLCSRAVLIDISLDNGLTFIKKDLEISRTTCATSRVRLLPPPGTVLCASPDRETHWEAKGRNSVQGRPSKSLGQLGTWAAPHSHGSP